MANECEKDTRTSVVALRVTADERGRIEAHRRRIQKRNPHLLVSETNALREIVAEGLAALERKK